MFKTMSIKKRLILLSACLLIIPSLLIGYIGYDSAKTELERKVLSSSKENIQLIDGLISRTIQPKMRDVGYFASKIQEHDVADLNEFADIYTLFEQYEVLNEEVMNVFTGTSDGKMFVYPHFELPEGFDPRERDWYKEAWNSPNAVISKPYKDTGTGKMVVTISKKLKDNSGVVGLDIDLDTLNTSILSVKIGREGYPFIVNPNNEYIIHPKEELGAVAKESWAGKIQQSPQGTLDYKLGNDMKQLTYITNKATGWKIAGTIYKSEISKDAQPILNRTLMVIIIALVIGSALTYFIIRRIVRPIRRLTENAVSIAEGNLNVDIHQEEIKEIGLLSAAFRTMTDSLKTLIHSIHERSDLLAASSEELSATTEQSTAATEQIARMMQELASGTDVQTAKVEKSEEAIEKMKEGIEEIAIKSTETSVVTQQANESVNAGNKAIDAAVTQMNTIDDTIKDLSTVIQHLNERSKQIEQITTVIDNIAGQTNLLALNAAIEAARAGEHGKGFAVVADEVRKLAEQSQQSANEIKSLIVAINQDMTNIVGSMDKGIGEVQKGIDVVNMAGSSFEDIQSYMEKVEQDVHATSLTTGNLAVSVSHVMEAFEGITAVTSEAASSIQNVSAATQEQLSSMEEVQASAESLSYIAEELQDMVKRFKL
ncbi:methyl-accepting chemotaxis protein [Priestia abyssalis]|uniref:methyl-accepting chemotaxis protein n=1 Tax=Priestia abyssalis TaxID=1221450 RepID=UPI0009956EE6|nr:methyl-accepting chemotaxis protein [Priestia abyssalis]